MAGLPSARDREAEFDGKKITGAEVLALIDAADDLIVETKRHIDADRLKAVFALPSLPADEVRSGLTWLVRNYGHAQEHLGQIQLTRQLYQGSTSP
jgi:hypothetical protein